MTLEYFFQLVGVMVVAILLFMAVSLCLFCFIDELFRALNNRIAERLVQLHGLIKIRMLYANRSRLVVVWKKDNDKNNKDDD